MEDIPDISKKYLTLSEEQKEAFLKDERKDARLYIVFFSLFAGFCLIGLHSLIVGAPNYPATDLNTFLFAFTFYPDLIVILFAVLGILNIFCVITRIQIHDKVAERHIPVDLRLTFYIRTNNAFKILLRITFILDIFLFIVFTLLTHAMTFLVVLIVTTFIYLRWKAIHNKLKAILEEEH
ncbi:MAG: hypothetical protein ACE5R6_01575 [Candidatus Heimdallarchaeota archaeon]